MIALADAVRDTAAAAVAALHASGIEVLTGDNKATVRRIADQLGIETVIAEAMPGDKADKVAELRKTGKRVVMVGDGINDVPAWPQQTSASPSAPVRTWPSRLRTWCSCARTRRMCRLRWKWARARIARCGRTLGCAIGCIAIALPIAAGVFVPAFGLVLRPEVVALSMSGSSLIVAVNALLLKWLKLPEPTGLEA